MTKKIKVSELKEGNVIIRRKPSHAGNEFIKVVTEPKYFEGRVRFFAVKMRDGSNPDIITTRMPVEMKANDEVDLVLSNMEAQQTKQP